MNIYSIIISTLSLTVALANYFLMDLPTPIHWGIGGEADSFGSQIFVFLFPLLVAACSLVFYMLSKVKDKSSFEKTAILKLGAVIVSFLFVFQVFAQMINPIYKTILNIHFFKLFIYSRIK